MTAAVLRPHSRAARCLFALAVFVVMAAAILTRPDKRLTDFDQSFYLTIAYDLVHHGTFSNGVFDAVDSTRAKPAPGMFFAPLYPLMVAGIATVDARFARTLDCIIEANEKHRDLAGCDHHALPLHLAHAMLAAVAVLAIAAAGEAIFASVAVFYLAGALATLGIAVEADLLSFLMTESLSLAVFSLFGLALVRAVKSARTRDWALAGLAAGVAALARPTYLLLVPIGLALLVAAAIWLPSLRGAVPAHRNDGRKGWLRVVRRLPSAGPAALAFCLAAALVLAPWLARNAVSVGKPAFTEEYGAAVIVERLAFNAMTPSEFALAFPYCVPVVGPAAVDAIAGGDAMARFEWDQPGSFFERGRAARDALVKAHGRLDPVMSGLLRAEMARDWWRHLASSVPLSWCGLWVSKLWSVPLLPLFAAACLVAWRRRAPLLILYAVPALALVGVHGVLANHYPRYNLGLIGPIAVGAAWMILRLLALKSSRRPT